MLLFNSCKNKTEKYLENEKYFNDIIFQTLEYKSKYGSKKAYAKLDSIKNNDPKINPLFDYWYYRFFASEYFTVGKLDSSKYYAQKLLPLLNKIGTTETLPIQYSYAYFTLSDIYYSQKEYLEAYRYLYLAKNTYGAHNVSLCEYNYRIGMILYNQENYILAARSFKKAITFKRKEDIFENLYRHQEILSNIGLSYYKANQLDSAVYWYQNALKFIDNFKSSEYDESSTRGCKGVIIGNLGQVMAKKENYSKAITLLKESISINEKSKDLAYDAFLQKIHLARIYLMLNNFKELELILADTENYLRKNPSLKPESDLLKIKADYSIKKEDFKGAISLIKKAENLKFRHNQQEGKFNQINLIEQLQILENETKLELLKKQNEVKNIYLIGTVILTLLSFVILTLIYNYWSKSKKTVKTLNTLNKKINEQSIELELKNSEKDKLMKIVAHDLRNPIGSIISISKLLLLEDEINEENRKMVSMTEAAATDALTLISEILENHNQQNYTSLKKSLSLNKITTQAFELLKFKTEDKQQNLNLNLLKTDVKVDINREQILRVLTNLVTNASKFSNSNTTIEINLKTENGFAIIVIKDQGVGIKSTIKTITDLTKSKKEGTLGEKSFGMGLDISKRIIDEHGGEIWFESDKSGSSFFVKLPIHLPL